MIVCANRQGSLDPLGGKFNVGGAHALPLPPSTLPLGLIAGEGLPATCHPEPWVPLTLIPNPPVLVCLGPPWSMLRMNKILLLLIWREGGGCQAHPWSESRKQKFNRGGGVRVPLLNTNLLWAGGRWRERPLGGGGYAVSHQTSPEL